MQYENVGVDQEGHLLYVKVEQQQEVPQQPMEGFVNPPVLIDSLRTPAKKREKSIFEPFFVIQDGVISLSVKNMTVIGAVAITVGLLYMLYEACVDGRETCNTQKIPMISAVICLHPFDRIFCILSIWYTLGVMHVNVRAVYKILYDKIDQGLNDKMYWLATIGCVALNGVGFFDEHLFGKIHLTVSITFFATIGIYAFILSNQLEQVKDKLPKENQGTIKAIGIIKWVMLTFLLCLGYGQFYIGTNSIFTPASEWLTTFSYLYLFVTMIGISPYYDSIHPYG